MIFLIVARNNDNVIGKDGKIPWHCSEDLKNFKKITTGKNVVMGRKTFESLGKKPLPNRKNIILSKNIDIFKEEYIGEYLFFNDIDKLIRWFNAIEEDLIIIGGLEIYKYFLDNDLIDKVYLSHIDNNCDGDTFFDYDFNNREWNKIEEVINKDFVFSIYERQKSK